MTSFDTFMCNSIIATTSIIKTFSSPQKVLSYSFAVSFFPLILTPGGLWAPSYHFLKFPEFVEFHVLPFLEFHVNGIIQSGAFCVWLVSLNIMLVRFIFVVVLPVVYLFLFLNNILLYGQIIIYLFTC